MRSVKVLFWWLQYHLVPVRHVSYRAPDANSLVVDMSVQKLTGGRFGFGYAHMQRRKCKRCGTVFYSMHPRDICMQWDCFKAQKEGLI